MLDFWDIDNERAEGRVGKVIVRRIYHLKHGAVDADTFDEALARVAGYEGPDVSEFKNKRGTPSALFKITYLNGELEGEEEELEAYEVEESQSRRRLKHDKLGLRA